MTYSCVHHQGQTSQIVFPSAVTVSLLLGNTEGKILPLMLWGFSDGLKVAFSDGKFTFKYTIAQAHSDTLPTPSPSPSLGDPVNEDSGTRQRVCFDIRKDLKAQVAYRAGLLYCWLWGYRAQGERTEKGEELPGKTRTRPAKCEDGRV